MDPRRQVTRTPKTRILKEESYTTVRTRRLTTVAVSGSKGITRGRGATLLVLLLLVLGGLVFALQRPVDGQSSSGAITQDWVNQKLVEWKPSSISPMDFGGVFTRASYDNIEASYNTPQVLSADLAMIESTGADYVRIDIGFDAWLQDNTAVKQELSTLASGIASDGKTLVIADAAAESYRHGGGLPWVQFQQAWINRVKTLAAAFQPAYYIVIKEPGWYVPMITDITTNPAAQDPNSWLNLTSYLASAVHSVSPQTRVGVSIAADSLSSNPSLYVPYLQGVSSMSGVSFIGFDLYTATGYTLTQNFISQYGTGGKGVWIAEAWSADAPTAFDSTRAQLDASWMWAAYYFGQQEHAQMIIPFFTDLFASYSLPTSTDSTQILSMYNQKTPVFSSYSDIIAGKPGPTPGQTSTSTSGGTTTTTHSGQSSQTNSSQTGQQGGGLGGVSLSIVVVAVVVLVAIVAVAVLVTRRHK